MHCEQESQHFCNGLRFKVNHSGQRRGFNAPSSAAHTPHTPNKSEERQPFVISELLQLKLTQCYWPLCGSAGPITNAVKCSWIPRSTVYFLHSFIVERWKKRWVWAAGEGALKRAFHLRDMICSFKMSPSLKYCIKVLLPIGSLGILRSPNLKEAAALWCRIVFPRYLGYSTFSIIHP